LSGLFARLPSAKLSILMPVYNERATLDSAIKEVHNVDFPCEIELVVVDDGSTDGTRDLYPGLLAVRASGCRRSGVSSRD
jgi:cellulose synthase/poly-beta-1,6-N-acetylglucosamine synthase-like glycosyltransferase